MEGRSEGFALCILWKKLSLKCFILYRVIDVEEDLSMAAGRGVLTKSLSTRYRCDTFKDMSQDELPSTLRLPQFTGVMTNREIILSISKEKSQFSPASEMFILNLQSWGQQQNEIFFNYCQAELVFSTILLYNTTQSLADFQVYFKADSTAVIF